MYPPHLTGMHRLCERVFLSRLPLEPGDDLIRSISTLLAHGERVIPSHDATAR